MAGDPLCAVKLELFYSPFGFQKEIFEKKFDRKRLTSLEHKNIYTYICCNVIPVQ
jgi:hypothetical protein